MKLLGSLFLFFGFGGLASGLLNYWIWWQVKGSEDLRGAEKKLVEDHSHGFFIFMLFIAAAFALMGLKLFRLKTKNSEP